MWHEIITWSYLELLLPRNVFLKMFLLYQNKKVTVIEIRNENERDVISYSQLKKSKISFVKKFQIIAIDLFFTLYYKVRTSRR